MMKILLTIMAIMVLLPASAGAQENVPQGNMTELPGNAYIVHDNNGRNEGIRIDGGGESILYRSLFGRYPNRYRNGSAASDVNSVCGHLTKVSEKNKCVGDFIKQREELREKYN